MKARKFLNIYSNGKAYQQGGYLAITPAGIAPIEQYDVTELTSGEVHELRSNPKSQKYKTRIRRLK